MKRIGNLAITGIALTSFLLMLTTIGLCIQSYFGQVGYLGTTDTDEYFFQNVRGGFQYVHIFTDPHGGINTYIEPGWYSGPAYPPVVKHLVLGFGAWQYEMSDSHVKAIDIPAWPMALLFSATPCLWSWRMFSKLRRSKRMRAGCCQKCGYDLRASGERCPECGVISEKPK